MKIIYLLATTLIFSSSAYGAENNKIKKIMNQEMIGVQRAYFEKITGVPKYVDRNYRSYDLDGCKISVKESKSKSIV